MTDEEFQYAMDRLVQGDKEGLRSIYDAYVKLIYSIVYNTLHNREDAEDVTSEFFVKLIRVAGTYKKGSPHKTWLVTIAKNMAIDLIRKKSHETTVVSANEDDTNDMIEEEIAHKEQTTMEDMVVSSHDIKNALAKLSDKEREIVHLKLMGQFKFREIAEFLGQPIGTVSWMYNQAIIKLRRCLADYE